MISMISVCELLLRRHRVHVIFVCMLNESPRTTRKVFHLFLFQSSTGDSASTSRRGTGIRSRSWSKSKYLSMQGFLHSFHFFFFSFQHFSILQIYIIIYIFFATSSSYQDQHTIFQFITFPVQNLPNTMPPFVDGLVSASTKAIDDSLCTAIVRQTPHPFPKPSPLSNRNPYQIRQSATLILASHSHIETHFHPDSLPPRQKPPAPSTS